MWMSAKVGDDSMVNSTITYRGSTCGCAVPVQDQGDCETSALCDGAAPRAVSNGASRPATRRIVLSISGPAIRAAGTVRSALQLIGGVQSVVLSRDSRRATVTYDPGKVETQQFIRALAAVGFEGSEDREFRVDN